MGAHTQNVPISVTTANGTVTRTYTITLPATCDASKPLPLLFAFHGDGGNGQAMYESFPIEAAASAAGGSAIFVYPNGTDDNIDPGGVARAWDIYHDPGYNELNAEGQSAANPYSGMPCPAMSDDASGNVDVDFFDAMVSYFEKTYCVDPTKVWITGISSGGYLANQFARWRSTVVNATAPQSGGAPFGNGDGVMGSEDDPTASDWVGPNYCVATTSAVPALIIHGLSDTTVDPCNAIEAQSYWELANGCANSANNCTTTSDSCTGTKLACGCGNPTSSATTTTSSLNSDCLQTSGCGASPVVLCQIPGMGHSIWSDAPQVIWSFFTSL
jgi:polyhydroxybutyrate depolymerase